MTNGKDAVTPTIITSRESGYLNGQRYVYGDTTNKFGGGLTKREYFAAVAMQGLLNSMGKHGLTEYGDIAYDAVMAADALINELNRNNQ